MDLVWNDLTVTSRDKTAKKLLNAINGQVRGRFMAIMGPSGSGKSTLLNVLSCRANNIKVSGNRTLDGQQYSSGELKHAAGYVMQDDLLSAHLSVYETLSYTAKLRLAKGIDEAARQKRVDECLDMVGLSHVKDVIVGDPSKKGISGGERKRLCVAIELLANPRLLFLDEPTSGLDSVTALSLCTILKSLTAAKDCTIICTIHQPQAKIFNMFDDLMLLCRGTLIYCGPAASAMNHFAAAGFPCPPFTNPADHLLDVLKENESRLSFLTTPHQSIDSSMQKVEGGFDSLAPNGAFPNAHLGAESSPRPYSMDSAPSPMSPTATMEIEPFRPATNPREAFKRKSWSQKLVILLGRSFKEQFRNRTSIIIQVVQTIIMAVLIGTVFLRIGSGQSSTVRRQPVLFFCAVNQGMFGAMAVINLFPSERVLMLRERAAGTYPVSAYLLARSTAETLMQVVVPIIFSIITYFLVGLRSGAGHFFLFMLYMILCSLASTSMALMVSALCRTTGLAVCVLPMMLELCRLFGGYFLSPANLPNYFSWLDAMSYVKYAYVGVSLNELRGLVLTCTKAQEVNGKCPISTGEQTIASLGLNKLTHLGCIGGLCIIIVVCRVITYLGLRFIKW